MFYVAELGTGTVIDKTFETEEEAIQYLSEKQMNGLIMDEKDYKKYKEE